MKLVKKYLLLNLIALFNLNFLNSSDSNLKEKYITIEKTINDLILQYIKKTGNYKYPSSFSDQMTFIEKIVDFLNKKYPQQKNEFVEFSAKFPSSQIAEYTICFEFSDSPDKVYEPKCLESILRLIKLEYFNSKKPK